MHSTNSEDYVSKFIQQVSKDGGANKQRYITRFNIYVLLKKKL